MHSDKALAQARMEYMKKEYAPAERIFTYMPIHSK